LFRIRLKELREKAGYSQYSFAAAFGTKQSTVGNWESGVREPKFDTMERLADFFGVSVDYLLGRTDNPTPLSEQKNTPVAAKNNDQDIHAEFVKFLIADGIIEKEEDITPEQVEVMREAFRSTMKILRPKA